MYFQYGRAETDCLKQRDAALGAVIDSIGHIARQVDTDLFSAVVHHIIGQQISTKAQATVWARMQAGLGAINAERVLSAGVDMLQSFGTTFRKAEYISDFARKVERGEFDLQKISCMTDSDAVRALAALKGVGVWTAEMILLFGLQRPDIFSFDDLAIRRGLRMVHRHTEIDRSLFEAYRRRYSPCCSVASLYLWAVAGGAVEGMQDTRSTRGLRAEWKN
ncbi:MAG: DNA-3-methyladenine glycosylase 2 family protein [Oscillospiraceae bacterium]|nr:DNA-3-methyladenine glycosylase 2 family protein [Oscillospiraceae bacterium]